MKTPRVTKIVMSSAKPRKRPCEGDRKVTKDGRVLVRRQDRYQGMYVVAYGRPVFSWVDTGEHVS